MKPRRLEPEGSLFEDLDDEAALAAVGAIALRSRAYAWNWWDPWPDGLSNREQCLRQVQRDMRALEELQGTDEDMRGFFEERIEGFKQLLTSEALDD